MEKQVALVIPDPDLAVQEAGDVVEMARRLEVRSQEDAETAAGVLQAVAEFKRAFRAEWDPVVAAAYNAHKAATAARSAALAPLEEAEKEVKRKLSAWHAEERRRLEEERRRLEEQARLEAQARREAERAELERMGIPPEAVEDEMVPVEVEALATVQAPEKPKVEGVSVVRSYDAEVVDMLALVRWVAENPELGLGLLQPNVKALRALAKAQKDALSLPGVRVIVNETVRRTGR